MLKFNSIKPKAKLSLPKASQLPVPQQEDPEPHPKLQPPPAAVPTQVNPYPIPPPPWSFPQYNQSMIQPSVDPLLAQNLSEMKDKISKTCERNQELESELKRLKEKGTEEVIPMSRLATGNKKSINRKNIELPQSAGKISLF